MKNVLNLLLLQYSLKINKLESDLHIGKVLTTMKQDFHNLMILLAMNRLFSQLI